MKYAIASVVLLVLLGCDHPEDNGKTYPPTINRSTSADGERVKIVYKQDFYDTTAYGGGRTIIVVKDSVTGKEFLGVSGMGVVELGAHQVGKSQQPDEHN